MPPTTVLAIEDLAVDVIVKAKLYSRVLIALLADQFSRHGCTPDISPR
jgi:hypothetical protein